LIVIVSGIAIRALWLTTGAFALRRLRTSAIPLEPIPASIRRAQERIATRARICISDLVSSPLTFGLLRPIVLVPRSVTAMPSHVQEAIAYHELLHVRRRDWLSEILEEAIRSVLWFHPAIWWLIGRIQHTREEVVDQAVIQLTESKEHYVESLLAVALAHSPSTFVPASTFLRRRLLKQRVARILQERTMTKRQLIGSLLASAAALGLAATLAVRAFPLEAQGRATTVEIREAQGRAMVSAEGSSPVQVLSGGEHLLHGDTPEYPDRAIEQKIEGDVVVDLTLNERGEVSDARILSGHDELRNATLQAVLRWHYAPSSITSTSKQATLRFHLPPGGIQKMEFMARPDLESKVRKAKELEPKEAPSPQELEHLMAELRTAIADPSLPDAQRDEYKMKYEASMKMLEKIRGERQGGVLEGPPRLAQIRAERVSNETVREILAQANLRVGDPISEETAKRLQQLAIAVDEHVRVEFEKARGGVVVTLLTR
jgi:TonB family protein